ncbi:MAG TPA: metallopeptidase TldD-related protein [Thermoplasmata archaeon]|nr:metallopeptidase TldD-related protein [Thermoplasmata archaeon]
MDLLDLAPDAVARARLAGADAAEAYAITFTTRSVYIEDNAPKVAEDRSETGLGLRVAKGKRVAFASTTLASEKDVTSAVNAATEGLKQVPEDPDFAGFPTETAKGEVKGAYDADTATTDVMTLLESAKDFTRSATGKKDTSVPKAVFRIQDYAFRIANSNNLLANHRGTLVFCYLTAKAGTKGKFGEGILKALNTSIRAIDFAALGAAAARRASENLRAKAYKSKFVGTAVLDPLDLGEIVIGTIGSAINGNDVHKKRSPWAGKIGQYVASAGVTIRDRPRMTGGLLSGVVDDEGSATRDRTLIQAGTLKGFIADHHHAGLVGMPAGNGMRRAVATVEGAYTRPADTALSNLVIEPGTKSLDALLAEVDRGVYVEKLAAPEVNPFSGSFAMEVRNATLIEKGALTDHVKVALLTGNFFEGLKNVVGIGRDLGPSHGFLTAPGCAYVPAIAFDGFELVGQT